MCCVTDPINIAPVPVVLYFSKDCFKEGDDNRRRKLSFSTKHLDTSPWYVFGLITYRKVFLLNVCVWQWRMEIVADLVTVQEYEFVVSLDRSRIKEIAFRLNLFCQRHYWIDY